MSYANTRQLVSGPASILAEPKKGALIGRLLALVQLKVLQLPISTIIASVNAISGTRGAGRFLESRVPAKFPALDRRT